MTLRARPLGLPRLKLGQTQVINAATGEVLAGTDGRLDESDWFRGSDKAPASTLSAPSGDDDEDDGDSRRLDRHLTAMEGRQKETIAMMGL